MRPLEEIVPELRIAARSLLRTPGFTLTAVLTLALGIGGTTAVFSVVNQVLLKPLPYAEPGELTRVYQTLPTRGDDALYVSAPVFLEYRQMRSFADVAASFTYTEIGANLTEAGSVERIRALPVTASYFQVLRAAPVLGRPFLAEEERAPNVRTAVLSHALWRRRFEGDHDIIGRSIMLDALPYEVVGVAPAGLEDPVVGVIDVWVPHFVNPADGAANHSLTVLARLSTGTPLDAARAELRAIDQRVAELYPAVADRPGRIVSLHQDLVASVARPLYVLLGAVGLVLLIVCVNLASLLLARATSREREFAVRAALGSGRARIMRQTLLESLLLGAAGGVAGVLLAVFLVDGIIAFGGAALPRLADVTFDVRVLGFSAALTIGSALLFGMLPSLRQSRIAPDAVLRGHARNVTADRERRRVRSTLVAAQIAMAFMLLAGASVLILSFHRVRSVDLGFASHNVLTFEVHLPTARYDSMRRAAFHETLADKLTALPQVIAAGAVSRLPATGTYHPWGARAATGSVAGTDQAAIGSQHRVVAGDYFDAVGVPLLAGRLFDARDDATQPRRVVISRSAAEAAFHGIDPLGQTLLVLGWPVEIIGVVGDVALTAEGEAAAAVYHTHRQFAGDRNWPLVQVVRTHRDPVQLLPSVHTVLTSLDAELVLHQPQTLEDVIGRGIAQRRMLTWLMTAFAVLALLLATLGIFGVVTYVVRQRRREIGIRAALGARPSQIRTTVLRHGMQVTALGLAGGLIGAVLASRALTAVVFRTEPAEPFVLAAAAVAMTVVAALATWLPAREATSVDPAVVLQED